MKRGTTELALGYVPQQLWMKYGKANLQAAILLQKLNAYSVNNLKKYMAIGHNKSIAIRMELKGEGDIVQPSAPVVSSTTTHNAFGHTDLTSTYNVCTQSIWWHRASNPGLPDWSPLL
ncbi:hypothetical protein TNCV_534731 [Trichonephila clavipes]|nr:hypothetical protein TNCV_534731 [Trichonephila clavipes]